jgi:hypothetical protein
MLLGIGKRLLILEGTSFLPISYSVGVFDRNLENDNDKESGVELVADE